MRELRLAKTAGRRVTAERELSLVAVRPELNAKKKIIALEHRKALLDALIDFVRTCPNISSESVLRQLYDRTGLYFYDTAIIRPLWDKHKDRVILRLEKYSEELADDYDPTDPESRTVCADVSNMSEKKLEKILDGLYKELHPDDDDDRRAARKSAIW